MSDDLDIYDDLIKTSSANWDECYSYKQLFSYILNITTQKYILENGITLSDSSLIKSILKQNIALQFLNKSQSITIPSIYFDFKDISKIVLFKNIQLFPVALQEDSIKRFNEIISTKMETDSLFIQDLFHKYRKRFKLKSSKRVSIPNIFKEYLIVLVYWDLLSVSIKDPKYLNSIKIILSGKYSRVDYKELHSAFSALEDTIMHITEIINNTTLFCYNKTAFRLFKEHLFRNTQEINVFKSFSLYQHILTTNAPKGINLNVLDFNRLKSILGDTTGQINRSFEEGLRFLLKNLKYYYKASIKNFYIPDQENSYCTNKLLDEFRNYISSSTHHYYIYNALLFCGFSACNKIDDMYLFFQLWQEWVTCINTNKPIQFNSFNENITKLNETIAPYCDLICSLFNNWIEISCISLDTKYIERIKPKISLLQSADYIFNQQKEKSKKDLHEDFDSLFKLLDERQTTIANSDPNDVAKKDKLFLLSLRRNHIQELRQRYETSNSEKSDKTNLLAIENDKVKFNSAILEKIFLFD